MGRSVALVKRLTPPVARRLSDVDAEAVRRNHEQRIAELQAAPAASLAVVQNVVLPNGVGVSVSHGLGRIPNFVGPSAIRGASTSGLIQDFGATDLAGNPVDRTRVVWLRAINFGGDITVDLLVL